MQTIGDEQNFQTLFCELRLEDERLAPRFSVVWNSAQASTRSQLGFKLAFVAATALLLVSLFSLALWLGGRPKNQQQNSATVIPPASPTVSPAPRVLEAAPSHVVPQWSSNRVSAVRRLRRLAERRRLEMLALRETAMRNALAISSWQSPTAMLMQSPADDVLTSLPQLNRSVNQVNSFLSDTQN